MWTDETRATDLIYRAVAVPVVQRLLYQSQMHIINFRNSGKRLHERFDELNFRNFARSQSCHMNDGLFGADIHAAHVESMKITVWGELLNTATAGHKFLRCVERARSKEKLSDWSVLRSDLSEIPDLYRRARDFLQHLDEAIISERVSGVKDCNFSYHGVLSFSDRHGPVEFDFTMARLSLLDGIWSKLLEMLESRGRKRG